MRRKLMTILSVLAALSLTATAVFAANVRISGVTWSIGSVIADGKLTGLDPTPVKVVLTANGTATVVCKSNDHDHSYGGPSSLSATMSGDSHGGTKTVPVTVTGTQILYPPFGHAGKSPFHVETAEPSVSSSQAGCSGHGGSYGSYSSDGHDGGGGVTILSVSWDSTNITVKDKISSSVLASQDYKCHSTATSLSCKKVKGHGDDDDDHD